ncbi:MAG: LamG domain-containing protein, partial [Patescibacteria group bacterium]
MKKKLFLILILPVLILVGAWFLRGVFATSNPNSWTNGLVGYWSFDGQYTTSTDGTKDVSNNGNWGSFNGGVKPVGGISGQALSFDGVDDYVKLESDEGLNLAANLTLEAWINYNGTGSTTIIDRREQCPASVRGWSQYHLSVSNSVINYNIDRTSNCSGGSGGDRYEGSSAVTANEWHHVAVTVIDNDNFSGGRTVKMYLDGNLESVTQTLDLGDSSSFSVDRNYNNFIGARSDVADYIYSSNGLIDEVRIYNRALSADEVKQHYERTRRNLVVNNPSGTPPVGWWKMDEATGATVRDYSVNGNTGTKYWMSTSTNYGLVDGKIGKALSFDGVDDYVDCGNGASLDMTTNNFTVETWIKRTANFS